MGRSIPVLGGCTNGWVGFAIGEGGAIVGLLVLRYNGQIFYG